MIYLVNNGIPHMEEIQKYIPKVWKSINGGSMYYRFRPPRKIEPDKEYPLLLFLHGTGGRGNDNKGQLEDAGSIEAFAKQSLSYNYASYIFAGQVPEGKKWVNVDWSTDDHKMNQISECLRMVFEAVDTFVVNKNNQVDMDRIYIMGLSMGGYGTWDAIQRRPDFFAAAVPICGGGDKTMGNTLSTIPIWSWHGRRDNVISVSRSRDMDIAIKNEGGSPKYTEVGERGHDVWEDVWNSMELWNWLYAQSKY